MAQRNRIFLALTDRQYLFVGSVLFCVGFFFSFFVFFFFAWGKISESI